MALPVLPNPTARRIFLARHALADAAALPAKGAALAALIDRIGFVQVDSITTVERAHHMILFARRQSYKPEYLKPLLETNRALFEHWTHDASMLPVALFPHWQHRFARDGHRLADNWRSWFRDGYEAKFEVFVPEAKRIYGYYVFPVLEAARLIGRIDVKAFRDRRVLRVRAFWLENWDAVHFGTVGAP